MAKGRRLRYENKPRNVVVCIQCGRSFHRVPSHQAKFCSVGCRKAHTRSRPSRITGIPVWKEARREALRRNPFCAFCGKLTRLDVHHIVPRRLGGDHSQKNLIPVCRTHHRRVELIYHAAENLPDLLWWRRYDLIGAQNLTRFVLGRIAHGEAKT